MCLLFIVLQKLCKSAVMKMQKAYLNTIRVVMNRLRKAVLHTFCCGNAEKNHQFIYI